MSDSGHALEWPLVSLFAAKARIASGVGGRPRARRYSRSSQGVCRLESGEGDVDGARRHLGTKRVVHLGQTFHGEALHPL
eukprot:scaffold481_cov122-Isochrysis_galbana.AAC.3